MEGPWKPPRPEPHYIEREIVAQRKETIFPRALVLGFLTT